MASEKNCPRKESQPTAPGEPRFIVTAVTASFKVDVLSFYSSSEHSSAGTLRVIICSCRALQRSCSSSRSLYITTKMVPRAICPLTDTYSKQPQLALAKINERCWVTCQRTLRERTRGGALVFLKYLQLHASLSVLYNMKII